MRCTFILTALCLSLSTAQIANAGQNEDDVQTYAKAAQHVIDMVNSGKVDVAVVEKDIVVALGAAVRLARAYSVKFPKGKKVVDTVIAKAAKLDASGNVTGLGSMADLPFHEIETEWHDTKYFVKNDMGLNLRQEANEHFTDPMHTVIHPLMVYVAAKDYAKNGKAESLKAMKAEMQEGIEQAAKTAKNAS